MEQIVKEIYLVRHGETEYNRQGIVQGSGIDAPLNENGLSQANAFYEAFKHLNFDKIYTSALQRSFQSVSGFIADGIPFEKQAGLNEISWGDYEKRHMNAHDKGYYHDLIKSWQDGDVGRPIAGGESPLDVVARQKPVIDLIFSRTDEKLILICMHGRAMRVILSTLLNTPLPEMEKYRHDNLGLYHLLVYENGSIHLAKENDIVHLTKKV